MPSDTTTLATTAVPQADDLDKVRATLAAVARGAKDTLAVAELTGFSLRHVEYRVRAATLLGLLTADAEGFGLTPTAQGLLDTRPQSEEERLLWRQALAGWIALPVVAPDLFCAKGPTRDELATRIASSTGLAASTAHRRAGTLLAWRRRLVSRQLVLFDSLDL
ncbi:MAG: hypothetical protein KC731_21840 [Myxococcales bacterium]|nr:hypothetical protein [Myxococcales bacterium]